MRLYEEADREEVLKVAYKHLGDEYVAIMEDILDNKENIIYVLDTKTGIRSFIVLIKNTTCDELIFTDLFDRFTLDSGRKFKEFVVNRTNTLIIHFTKNKEVLERAIKPYGGYVVYDCIVVPKKEIE